MLGTIEQHKAAQPCRPPVERRLKRQNAASGVRRKLGNHEIAANHEQNGSDHIPDHQLKPIRDQPLNLTYRVPSDRPIEETPRPNEIQECYPPLQGVESHLWVIQQRRLVGRPPEQPRADNEAHPPQGSWVVGQYFIVEDLV